MGIVCRRDASENRSSQSVRSTCNPPTRWNTNLHKRSHSQAFCSRVYSPGGRIVARHAVDVIVFVRIFLHPLGSTDAFQKHVQVPSGSTDAFQKHVQVPSRGCKKILTETRGDIISPERKLASESPGGFCVKETQANIHLAVTKVIPS